MLQGVPGVGQTVVAALLVQYLQDTDRSAIAIDCDPTNRALATFQAIGAETLDLSSDSKTGNEPFNDLFERIMSTEADFVIDVGAPNFLPAVDYLVRNNVGQRLDARGRQLVVHCVVAGGRALGGTINGLRVTLRDISDSTKLIVWLNGHFGEIANEGEQFEESDLFRGNKAKIWGLAHIRDQRSELFAKAFNSLLKARMTFREVNMSDLFFLMDKQRLTMMSRTIFQQFALVLP